jgi:hypothetical protein
MCVSYHAPLTPFLSFPANVQVKKKARVMAWPFLIQCKVD